MITIGWAMLLAYFEDLLKRPAKAEVAGADGSAVAVEQAASEDAVTTESSDGEGTQGLENVESEDIQSDKE